MPLLSIVGGILLRGTCIANFANYHLPESLGFPDPHVAQLVKPQSNENSFSTNPAVSARYFFPTNECHSQRW